MPESRIGRGTARLAGGSLGLLFSFVLCACDTGRARRAAERAAAYLATSNYPAASLSARHALLLNSNSVVAWSVLAEIADRSQSPQALDWRRRIAALEPYRDSNQIALARTALHWQRLSLAQRALSTIPDASNRRNGEYHGLAAQCAMASQDLQTAREHLLQAAACEPANRAHQYNLAILQLHHAEGDDVENARHFLDRHHDDPLHGAAILRALAAERLQRDALQSALEWSLRLQDRPEAGFEDHLVHLTILFEMGRRDSRTPGFVPSSAPGAESPESDRRVPEEGRSSTQVLQEQRFNRVLLRAQQAASSDPDKVAGLMRWLSDHALTAAAISWLESLTSAVRNANIVRRAEAECYLATKNWKDLRTTLTGSHWSADDPMRHALLALTYRQQGEERLASLEWKRAVRAGREGFDSLRNAQALIRFAGAWEWEKEAEDLLWEVVAQGNDSGWALAVLRQSYEIGANTRALLRVFTVALEQDPGDRVAMNNLAAASLLLGTNLITAHQMARELHAEQPTNATVACTYAFSLHLQGRSREAWQILSDIPAALLREPSTAAYCAVILAAQGCLAEAQEYCAIARAGSLLPEERALLQRVPCQGEGR